MSDEYTPGAFRALRRATVRSLARGASEVEPLDLLAALLDESESQAYALLEQFGARTGGLLAQSTTVELPAEESDGPSPTQPFGRALRMALAEASLMARSEGRSQGVATEHLLAGLVETSSGLADILTSHGLDLPALMDYLHGAQAASEAPVSVPIDIAPLDLGSPTDIIDLARIMDASANRAGEGLRVIEDYARFVLDDPFLTRRLKEVRHRLARALSGLELGTRLAARDTPGDVGTHITTPAEQVRENPRAVLAANFRRTAEALRTLEEYSKLTDSWLAGRFEVLRYDTYSLEKWVLTAVASHQTLGEANLCVLAGGSPTLGHLTWVVGEAIEGGAQVIQLREKNLPDREILSRAREVRILTAKAGVRFIMNDRPDLARLSGADGVHLGQEDVAARDARRIMGQHALLGISTHRVEELDAAVKDGASYLGVGPVFSSSTKSFEDLAGLIFVREAAMRTSLPWFAIGGINRSNIEQVMEAGARRVAVSSAVMGAESPRAAAAALRQVMG